jgi:hypothetical protein
VKKLIFLTLAMALFFALTSIAYSADEALTPEKVSGIWEGSYYVTWSNDGYRHRFTCRILITPTLSGVLNCINLNQGSWQFDLSQGEIISNQLVMRDLKNTDTIRIKANITGKNILEGEFQGINNKGDLFNFKKKRDLTAEEKQRPLSQLEGLVNY